MTNLVPNTGAMQVRDYTDVRLFKMHMDTLARLRAYGYATPAVVQQLWTTSVAFWPNRGRR